MHNFLRSTILAVPIATAFLFGARAQAATILFEDLLANHSFEASTSLTTCPTSWTCTGPAGTGLVATYAPTNTEYIAGANGLSGSMNAPDGNNVATTPVPVEGSGAMYQLSLGTYAAGNTYMLNLWVGTPLVVPSVPADPAGPVGTIRIFFLGDLGISGSLAEVSATPSATPGQWTFQQFSFTPTGAQVGQSIGLEIAVDSAPPGGGSGNNRVTDFDIAGTPSTTPEPASMALLGFGLIGIAAAQRKLKLKS